MTPQLLILQALENIHPRMQTVKTLFSEVRLDDDSVSYSAFKKALRELDVSEQIVVIPGQDRDKAKITAEGLARLAENA